MIISSNRNIPSNQQYLARIGRSTRLPAAELKTPTITDKQKISADPNFGNAINLTSRDGDRLTISKQGMDALFKFKPDSANSLLIDPSKNLTKVNTTVPQGAIIANTPNPNLEEAAFRSAYHAQNVQPWGSSGGVSPMGAQQVDSSAWSDNNGNSGSTVKVTDKDTGVTTTQTKQTNGQTGETTKHYKKTDADGNVIKQYTETYAMDPNPENHHSNYDPYPGIDGMNKTYTPNAYDKRGELYDNRLIIHDPETGAALYGVSSEKLRVNLSK